MLKVMRDHESWFAKLSIDEKKTVINAGFTWDDILQRWQGSARAAYRLIDHVADPVSLLSELKLQIHCETPQIQYARNRGVTP